MNCTCSTQLPHDSMSLRTSGCRWSIYRPVRNFHNPDEMEETNIYAQQVVIVAVLGVYPFRPALVLVACDAVYALRTRAVVPIETCRDSSVL